MSDKPFLPKNLLMLTKMSLGVLWIFTGLTSVFFAPEIGYALLAEVDIEGNVADFFVYSASFLDICLGIWVLTPYQQRFCCLLQVWTILLYTFLLTLIDASYWLNPFGPLTKNIPVLVLIVMLHASNNDKNKCTKTD